MNKNKRVLFLAITVALLLSLAGIVYAQTTAPGWASTTAQNRIRQWFIKDQYEAIYELLNDMGDAGGYWSELGNAGTTPGTHYVGTSDAQDLVLAVNGTQRFRFEVAGGIAGGTTPTSSGTDSTVSGGRLNIATGNYATVGGGQTNRAGGGDSTIAGGDTNAAYGTASGIASGADNLITCSDIPTGTGATGSFIGGGTSNTISSTRSIIGGGTDNTISGIHTRYAFIGGGDSNVITGTYDYNAIAGGTQNMIWGEGGFIGSGNGNQIQDGAFGAIVSGASNQVTGSYGIALGGLSNDVIGDYSAAGGRKARARYDGSFVWADSDDAECNAYGVDTFNVCADGGLYMMEGPLYSLMDTDAQITTYTALVTETGKIFTNQGDGDGATITLPDAQDGLWYCFYTFAAQTFYVDPATGDQIHTLTNAAGDRISNATAGDSICLHAVDTTYWIPMQEVGTWADAD